MQKVTLLVAFVILVFPGFSKPVSLNEARTIADNYYGHISGRVSPDLNNAFSVKFNGINVYHVFNYKDGGFVAVSADDAVIPILAESGEGFMEPEIANPTAKYWFECYSKEIIGIIIAGVDNSKTLQQWNRIRGYDFDRSTADIGPLVTTTWDQGEWYSYYCPAASGGPGGTVLSPVSGLSAVVTGHDVRLDWNAPQSGTVLGYKVYRNDTLLTTTSVVSLFYDDSSVPVGKQTYCVTAVYQSGESASICADATITFVFEEYQAEMQIYPNPAAGMIQIHSPVQFTRVKLVNLSGSEIYVYDTAGKELTIPTEGIKPGVYFLMITLEGSTITRKISIL